MKIVALLGIGLLLAGASPCDKPAFTVGWSLYVGWNPYYYMNKSGILKKWADKYGVTIKVQRFDYAPSLDAYVAKSMDACTTTNMEALDMPAAAGVDTTAIILGDYSNGNDAVLVRNGLTFYKLGGKKVMLVQKTVSEYLFERGMTISGAKDTLKWVKLVNTSDSDIAAAFLNNPNTLMSILCGTLCQDPSLQDPAPRLQVLSNQLCSGQVFLHDTLLGMRLAAA